MQNVAEEKLLYKILALGSACVTIFLISGSVTDPVNTPKFLILGALAVSAFSLVFTTKLRLRLRSSRAVILILGFFILCMVISAIFSKGPFSQNLYGSYGRNNGFLTYLFLSLVLCSALALRATKGFELIIKGILIAGIVNIIYCLWVITFGDFIGWTNPYGNILGTLGNPDFIGAFLGIFFTSYLAYGISDTRSRFFKLSMLAVLPITGYEIVKSHAIQGRVVAVLGASLVGFFYIRMKFGMRFQAAYVAISILSGILAICGALQIGPLTKYIYKTSVSLRGQYWLAAWNAGKSHPLTGIGMDSFGDWYRRSRSPHAIQLPGVNTVVNAAHNVWMDMFAFGGLPLLISYLAILIATAISIARVILRGREYNAIFVAMTSAWVCYQAQSIISINQIGLVIWGWLLSGALIAYEVATRTVASQSLELNKKKGSNSLHSSQYALGSMFAVFGALIGLLLSAPPLIADSKWRSAQVKQSLPETEATMTESYFNPQNSQKYLVNIQTLESSQLFDVSHKYALSAVKWNPDVFELWKTLYFLKSTTNSEKVSALRNMKRLDPLNPDVTSIK